MKLSTASGVLVLVTGLIAIGLTARSDDAPSEGAPTEQTQIQPALATPAIEGVTSSVQRVLSSYGKLETLNPSSVSELPPEVAKVLSYYGATLTVPQQQESGA